MTDIDGHVQNDPLFREQSEIYSSLGGELPIRIFSSISGGMNMNGLADRLIDFDDRWNEQGNFQTFELQARDAIDQFEDKKLIQDGNDGWSLTNYGQQWRAQIDAANQTLLDLVNDNKIAASRFEAESGQIVYNGENTLGDFYNALGFNVGVEPYPEALPALHILAEDANDGEVPQDYIDGVEQLELMGMAQNTDYDGDTLETDITEIGQRIYDEVVLDDREFVAQHYGLV